MSGVTFLVRSSATPLVTFLVTPRVMFFLLTPDRSLAKSLDIPLVRSLVRFLAMSIIRPLVTYLARSHAVFC